MSLALCVGVVTLWVRSHSVTDYVWRTHRTEFRLTSAAGLLKVHVLRWGERLDPSGYRPLRRAVFPPRHAFAPPRKRGLKRRGRALGFEYASFEPTPHALNRPGVVAPAWWVIVPHWSLVLLTGAAPAWWLVGARRRSAA